AKVESDTQSRAAKENERGLAELQDEVERLRGAEVTAREDAANWLRGRTKSLDRAAEDKAKEQVAAARREEAESREGEIQKQVEKLRAKLEREAEQRAERHAAQAR